MHDFSDLAATVGAKRAELLEREALERNRRSGLLSLRPLIDHLEANVRPTLEAAKATLLPAGIRLEIEDGWSEACDKRASLTIFGSTAGTWSSFASHARSGRFTITADSDGALALACSSGGGRDDAAEPIELSADADVASETIRCLVDDLLARVDGQPVLRARHSRSGGLSSAGARQ